MKQRFSVNWKCLLVNGSFVSEIIFLFFILCLLEKDKGKKLIRQKDSIHLVVSTLSELNIMCLVNVFLPV